jgi:hypothetical protein
MTSINVPSIAAATLKWLKTIWPKLLLYRSRRPEFLIVATVQHGERRIRRLRAHISSG